MSATWLSDHQQSVLLALAEQNGPVTGSALADRMTTLGHSGHLATPAGAGQAADALDFKGLATKRRVINHPIQYELTDAGRELAAQIRSAR